MTDKEIRSRYAMALGAASAGLYVAAWWSMALHYHNISEWECTPTEAAQ